MSSRFRRTDPNCATFSGLMNDMEKDSTAEKLDAQASKRWARKALSDRCMRLRKEICSTWKAIEMYKGKLMRRGGRRLCAKGARFPDFSGGAPNPDASRKCLADVINCLSPGDVRITRRSVSLQREGYRTFCWAGGILEYGFALSAPDLVAVRLKWGGPAKILPLRSRLSYSTRASRNT